MYTISKRDMTEEVRRTWHMSAGLTVSLSMVPDEHSSVDDFDSYSDAAVEAWRQDAWHYVGLIVTVYGPHGGELGDFAVFGFEYGRFVQDDGTDLYLDPSEDVDCYGDLIHEAMSQAQANVIALRAVEIGEKA